MQSPPVEWLLYGAYGVALDAMRAKGDPDKDTLSEVVRDLIYRHPSGRAVFTLGYTAGAVLLWRHLVKE